MTFNGKNSFAKAPQNITLFYTAYIVFPYIQNFHQFRRTQQKVPDKSEVQSSLQNCGSTVCNLLHVTRWRLEFCKPLLYFILAIYDEGMYWHRTIIFPMPTANLIPDDEI
jgi:hypothetical protein